MKCIKCNFLYFLVLLTLGSLLGACAEEKEDEQPVFTEALAVEMISESLTQSTGGLAKDVESMKGIMDGSGYFGSGGAEGNGLVCGISFDTTVTYILSGAASGTFVHQLNLLLNCINGIPQSLDATATYTGNFSGTNLTQSSQGGRQWTWTGFGPESDVYVLNGSGNRNGTRTYLVGNQNTFDRAIQSSLTNVTVSKTTGFITGGNGEAIVTLTSSNGDVWVRECTIVFNGDGTATLTINGNVYTITLAG